MNEFAIMVSGAFFIVFSLYALYSITG
jgi:hypothetical protein